MARTRRPTYQDEPREQLEERLRIICDSLGLAILNAREECCGCATCQVLRDMGSALDMAAAMNVNLTPNDRTPNLGDWPITPEEPQ